MDIPQATLVGYNSAVIINTWNQWFISMVCTTLQCWATRIIVAYFWNFPLSLVWVRWNIDWKNEMSLKLFNWQKNDWGDWFLKIDEYEFVWTEKKTSTKEKPKDYTE